MPEIAKLKKAAAKVIGGTFKYATTWEKKVFPKYVHNAVQKANVPNYVCDGLKHLDADFAKSTNLPRFLLSHPAIFGPLIVIAAFFTPSTVAYTGAVAFRALDTGKLIVQDILGEKEVKNYGDIINSSNGTIEGVYPVNLEQTDALDRALSEPKEFGAPKDFDIRGVVYAYVPLTQAQMYQLMSVAKTKLPADGFTGQLIIRRVSSNGRSYAPEIGNPSPETGKTSPEYIYVIASKYPKTYEEAIERSGGAINTVFGLSAADADTVKGKLTPDSLEYIFAAVVAPNTGRTISRRQLRTLKGIASKKIDIPEGRMESLRLEKEITLADGSTLNPGYIVILGKNAK